MSSRVVAPPPRAHSPPTSSSLPAPTPHPPPASSFLLLQPGAAELPPQLWHEGSLARAVVTALHAHPARLRSACLPTSGMCWLVHYRPEEEDGNRCGRG
jgi:hypothetical protein